MDEHYENPIENTKVKRSKHEPIVNINTDLMSVFSQKNDQVSLFTFNKEPEIIEKSNSLFDIPNVKVSDDFFDLGVFNADSIYDCEKLLRPSENIEEMKTNFYNFRGQILHQYSENREYNKNKFKN